MLRTDYIVGESFLKTIEDVWSRYCHEMLLIRSIFLYLDRTYVLQTHEVLPIWELGLNLFNTHIMSSIDNQNRTVDGLLNLIEKERNGKHVDRKLLKNLLHMLSDLGLYQKIFEVKFFEITDNLYKVESQLLVDDLEISDYLKHINKRIGEEKDRLLHYLDCSTEKSLISAVEKYFIGDHIASILLKIDILFNESRMNDLRQFYSLVSKVDGHFQFCSYFEKFVEKKGIFIVTDLENERIMIQDLLDFKEEMYKFLNICFEKDVKYVSVFEKAFKLLVNKRPSKASELLAKYFNSKLQSGNKEDNEGELEDLICRAVDFLKYINDKDLFKAFYKKDLSKRLLFDSCSSIDAEKSVVSKLKLYNGSLFVLDMEVMFKDIERSKTLTATFNEDPSLSNFSSDVELSVNILTTEFWPSYPEMEINLPGEMAIHQDRFQTFYLMNHNGRKLKWHPFLSCCVLRANFPQGTKELRASLLQTIVLLLFNEGDCFTFEEIWNRTDIEYEVLKRTLDILACGKMKFLCKSPKCKDIGNKDKFFYNGCYKNKHFKININKLQMNKSQENMDTVSEIFQIREFHIDAAIVRIMKTRKSLLHSLLISELMNHLKFQVKLAHLKSRIENLIDREYLERDPNDYNLYHYVT
ncbi:Cullin-4A [Araneus ventricosus]|uniref:Cullin-4A n=1 Tax=Araneus ventricosus TaxID=182803 RepID=A0A4Y2ASY6_ARAVE|nr:Cullin-4A [Araneus ventricosus]